MTTIAAALESRGNAGTSTELIASTRTNAPAFAAASAASVRFSIAISSWAAESTPSSRFPYAAFSRVHPVRRGGRRYRHQPPVPGRQVTGVEVQADQLDTGVRQRGDERVRVGVRGGNLLERPPELHGAEPGGPGGGRPGEQRQLGEQDRAVHVEPQAIRPHRGTYLAFHSRRAAGRHIRGTWPRAASMIVVVSWSVSGHSSMYDAGWPVSPPFAPRAQYAAI